MPPSKPSPHRFIAPHPTSSQTPKVKSKSTLRHAITPQQTTELHFKKLTPAKRFVVASAPRSDAVESVSHAPTPRPRAQRLERAESIEEASQSSPARLPDEDAFGVVETVERGVVSGEGNEQRDDSDDNDEDDDDDDDDELLFESHLRSKRRRTSPPATPPRLQPHPEPPLYQDHPSSPLTTAPHRFRFPVPINSRAPTSTTTTTTTTPTTTPAPTRPHFLLPPRPPSPSHALNPLPSLFSPARKTHKHIPNGLAATMQRWIIEAGSSRAREDETEQLKFRVCALGLAAHGHGHGGAAEVLCLPGSAVFLEGQAVRVDEQSHHYHHHHQHHHNHPERAKEAAQKEIHHINPNTLLLLAGQGGVRTAAGVRIRVGDVVGLRAPTWDVCVRGEKWVVGVEWVVL